MPLTNVGSAPAPLFYIGLCVFVKLPKELNRSVYEFQGLQSSFAAGAFQPLCCEVGVHHEAFSIPLHAFNRHPQSLFYGWWIVSAGVVINALISVLFMQAYGTYVAVFRQEFGWSFDFPHLHSKSGSLSPLKHFAYDLRDIVKRQPLPGYRLTIEQCVGGPEILSFVPTDPDALGIPRRRRRTKPRPGDKL